MNTDYENWDFESLRAECVRQGILPRRDGDAK